MRSEAKKYVGVKKEYDALVRKRKKPPAGDVGVSGRGFVYPKIIP